MIYGQLSQIRTKIHGPVAVPPWYYYGFWIENNNKIKNIEVLLTFFWIKSFINFDMHKHA
jgi:hypothetical protein